MDFSIAKVLFTLYWYILLCHMLVTVTSSGDERTDDYAPILKQGSGGAPSLRGKAHVEVGPATVTADGHG